MMSKKLLIDHLPPETIFTAEMSFFGGSSLQDHDLIRQKNIDLVLFVICKYSINYNICALCYLLILRDILSHKYVLIVYYKFKSNISKMHFIRYNGKYILHSAK